MFWVFLTQTKRLFVNRGTHEANLYCICFSIFSPLCSCPATSDFNVEGGDIVADQREFW